MDPAYPRIAASLAEDGREEIIDYVPLLVKILRRTKGQPRRDAARALAAIATSHAEAEIDWIHDLVRQLGPEDLAVNRHLIRAIRGLIRSDKIAKTPAPTRRTATYSMWRSDAFDLTDETDPTDPVQRPETRRSDIFSVIPEGDARIRIHDRVMERQLLMESSRAFEQEKVDLNQFEYPVDFGFRFCTDQLKLPNTGTLFIRNQDGSTVTDYRPVSDGIESLSDGAYSLEFSAPFKTYLRFENEFEVRPGEQQTGFELSWPSETVVKIGVRSRHEQPSGTITTSSDPREMMIALSRLGSALKTKSSERSYPTLRAHPPMIELGERLSIPPNIGTIETGVVIEVPEEYEYIFTVAPLAYYLGARIVPGETPRLLTESGFVHPLGETRAEFEAEVARVLKQSFVFDCFIRTEGHYDVELAERNSIEPYLDVDLGNLYGRPLSERLEAALTASAEYFEPYMPTWQAESTVVPEPESVEALPFLVTDMSTIRTRSLSEVELSSSQHATKPVGEFVRAEYDGDAGTDLDELSSEGEKGTQVEVPETGSDVITRRWVGDGIPINASKTLIEGYKNGIRTGEADSSLRVAVVLNDPRMSAEGAVMETYRDEAVLPTSIDIHESLTKAELRALLSEEVDLLHYVGHVTDEGIQCTDGTLDVGTVNQTRIRAFILNACRSHQQGTRLVEAGATGGVVTIANVVNSYAVTMGQQIANLLNRGFTLTNAMKVATDNLLVGGEYLVLGNGGVTLSQSDSGLPMVYSVTETEEETFSVHATAYPSGRYALGTIATLASDGEGAYHLAPGDIGQMELTEPELRQYVDPDSPTVRWRDENGGS
jgi:hypothetical protein